MGVVLLLLLTMPAFAIGRAPRWPQAMMVMENCEGNPCPCSSKSSDPVQCPEGMRCVPQPTLENNCVYTCESIPAQADCCPKPTQYGYQEDDCSHHGDDKCKSTETCCFDGCRNTCQPLNIS